LFICFSSYRQSNTDRYTRQKVKSRVRTIASERSLRTVHRHKWLGTRKEREKSKEQKPREDLIEKKNLITTQGRDLVEARFPFCLLRVAGPGAAVTVAWAFARATLVERRNCPGPGQPPPPAAWRVPTTPRQILGLGLGAAERRRRLRCRCDWGSGSKYVPDSGSSSSCLMCLSGLVLVGGTRCGCCCRHYRHRRHHRVPLP
jgi:hypothetical protein